MKIKEIINEGGTGSLTTAVKRALPATIEFPNLPNQDPYLQYRMGIALAAARAPKTDDSKFYTSSAFGENMSIVSYTDADLETIQLAAKLIGKEYTAGSKMISTTKSEEAQDVSTQSPIQPRGPIKRKN